MKLTKQDIGVWVKASDELPAKRGVENSVIIRGCNMPNDSFGHGINGEFVTTGFLNFDEESPLFYFIYGNNSYLSNETIEWLKPIQGVYALTSEDLENIFEAGYKCYRSMATKIYYDEAAKRTMQKAFNEFIKSITS